jgi:hypothetical protein
MANTLDLKHMSIEKKIQTMKSILGNLCEKAGSLSSPSWHKNILREREKSIKSGDEKFMSWDKAKKDIQDKTS